MPRTHLCSECVAAGVQTDEQAADDMFLVACSFCGAIDEHATYQRNTTDVHDRLGTLMEGHQLQFRDYQEKRHEAFVDMLLDEYLVRTASRVVEHPAGHFKAGVKTWYNRYRQWEQATYKFQGPSTNSKARKVKYILAVAINITILESNVVVVNNRLEHIRPNDETRTVVPAAKGDGTIMAPSLHRIYLNSLGPSHVGYIDNYSLLRKYYGRFKIVRGAGPTFMEITLAQVYALSQRVQFLARLPPAERIGHLAVKTLKLSAIRAKTTVEAAQPDDFALGIAEWDFINTVDWDKTFENAYHLYCAQQVVALWGNRCYIDIAVALLEWAIMTTTGCILPSVGAWTEELAVAYGGSATISQRRREELKDFLVGWSSSFPEAGIPVPILPTPRKGGMGDGLSRYGSDKRRPIPEMVMAVAAAPVVASRWRQIMETRLRVRTTALPLDTEYTMAAKMFANAYNADVKKRQAEARARKAASAPGSRRGSRAGSRGAFTPIPPRATSQPLQKGQQARSASPSIETLLATRDDSSDEDPGQHSETESECFTPHVSGGLDLSGLSSMPFEFSIGPTGFSVATNESTQPTVPVNTSIISHRKHSLRPTKGDRPAKRLKPRPVVTPMSPPPTSPSSRGLSPAPLSLRSVTPNPSDVRFASPTPSLRSITMSPSLTAISITEPSNLAHVGVLSRERGQYMFYNKYNEQRKGTRVPPHVEQAMARWVADAKAKGIIPAAITPRYLETLGFHDDPRLQDVGPFIHAHPEWSPVESLLRLGLQPAEFPAHFVVHSLLDLSQQLGGFKWEARLASEGKALNEAELNTELDMLFSSGPENWRDLLATPQEAAKKEKLYRASGAWQYARDVPEGHAHRLDKDKDKDKDKRKRAPIGEAPKSSRINYDALGRLIHWEPEDEEDDEARMGEDGKEDGDEGLIVDVVHETLWNTLGREAVMEDDDDNDDGGGDDESSDQD